MKPEEICLFQVLAEDTWVEPANSFISFVELACLVDVDIASLLSGSLGEVLVVADTLQSCLEYASFVGKVLSRRQLKLLCNLDLLWMQETNFWIIAEVIGSAFPMYLES